MEIQPAESFNPSGGAARNERPRETNEAHRAKDSTIERREAERSADARNAERRAQQARQRRKAENNRVDLNV